MKISKLILTALISTIFLSSCSKEEDATPTPPLGSYDNGTLILNQGGFGQGNATISYFSNDLSVQQNNIFALVNPTITLGDTAQDIGLYESLAFIILNNSNKIEVVNRYTMVHVATVSVGLNNPRYIAFANGKGYITNWGDGTSTTDDYVAVLNLTTYQISSSIPVIEGPERIIEYNNKLYIAQIGGYGFGNKISILNPTTNTIETLLNVGDVPNSLKVKDATLYVICGGKPSYASTETTGKLSKINLSTNAVTSIDFPGLTHPSNLEIVDDLLFYTVDSSIFKSTVTATSLPTTAIFSTAPQGVNGIYSFAVRNNKIFVGDAGDYNSNGKVYVYSTTGTLQNNFTVGIIPAGFYFN